MDLKILKNGSVAIKVTPEEMGTVSNDNVVGGSTIRGEVDAMNRHILKLTAKSIVINQDPESEDINRVSVARELALFIKENLTGLTER